METIGGLATIPSRESTLRYIIDSILPQVDHLYVAFNDYSELPIWLTEYSQKLHFFLTEKDNMGDAEKFRFVEEFEDAIYCSIDDDLIYPPFYVKNLIRGIEKYDCVVSLHGRVYPRPVQSFAKWSMNYRCLGKVTGGADCDLLGTGCMAFSTKRLKLKYEDFLERNMADVWVSKVSHEQGVPLKVLKHSSTYLTYIPQKETIWRSEQRGKFERQTEILKSFLK